MSVMKVTDVFYTTVDKAFVSVSSTEPEVITASETVIINSEEYGIVLISTLCGCEKPTNFNLILKCKRTPKKKIEVGDTMVKLI